MPFFILLLCRCNRLPRMQRVLFSHNVSVHYITDITSDDRKGPWTFTLYVDAERFRRRIRQISKTLDRVLTVEHRITIMLRNATLNVSAE
jgi:Phosphatase-1 catalytic subunit binding region